jgi:hypothetical protein
MVLQKCTNKKDSKTEDLFKTVALEYIDRKRTEILSIWLQMCRAEKTAIAIKLFAQHIFENWKSLQKPTTTTGLLNRILLTVGNLPGRMSSPYDL